MTQTIDAGQLVPDLTLPDDHGNDVRLRDLAGKTVILYFYPKDDTPGCTTQACDLRDNWATFDRDDIALFGVSPDDVASHQKFRDKHGLPFPLLVDADHELAEAFGIWTEKSMYGRKYMGIERSTVVVAPDGTVQSVHRKVKPAGHVQLLRDELGLDD
jgi:peroxiredoxin Q/BCP